MLEHLENFDQAFVGTDPVIQEDQNATRMLIAWSRQTETLKQAVQMWTGLYHEASTVCAAYKKSGPARKAATTFVPPLTIVTELPVATEVINTTTSTPTFKAPSASSKKRKRSSTEPEEKKSAKKSKTSKKEKASPKVTSKSSLLEQLADTECRRRACYCLALPTDSVTDQRIDALQNTHNTCQHCLPMTRFVNLICKGEIASVDANQSDMIDQIRNAAVGPNLLADKCQVCKSKHKVTRLRALQRECKDLLAIVWERVFKQSVQFLNKLGGFFATTAHRYNLDDIVSTEEYTCPCGELLDPSEIEEHVFRRNSRDSEIKCHPFGFVLARVQQVEARRALEEHLTKKMVPPETRLHFVHVLNSLWTVDLFSGALDVGKFKASKYFNSVADKPFSYIIPDMFESGE